MAELTPKERLQPSLLDRLTDDAPDSSQESRDQRVLSMSRLRAGVLRDLVWLLNTGRNAAPSEADSVLGFGIPDLVGTTLSSADLGKIEQQIRQAIRDFEPRIRPQSVSVKVSAAETQMSQNAMTFAIEGELWAQPLPLHLYLKTELDLETGHLQVLDQGG